MRPSDSRSLTVLPGTSQDTPHTKGTILPPLSTHYPQWSRGGKLGLGLYQRPLSSDGADGLPFPKGSLQGKVQACSVIFPAHFSLLAYMLEINLCPWFW